MTGLPGRASDAGPESGKYCPACGSSKWNTCGYCHGAHAEMCDLCAPFTTATELYCDRCMMDVEAENDPGCPTCGSTAGTPVDYDFGVDPETGYHDAGVACTECRGPLALQPIAARVVEANAPEWRNEDAPF